MSDGKTTLAFDQLPDWVNETYVWQLFAATNAVASVKLFRSRVSAGCKLAHIEFTSSAAAESCLQLYNGKAAPNTNLKIELTWASDTNWNEEFSAFVGDVAPDVSDADLLHAFQSRYTSCFAAKVQKGFGFVRFGAEADRDRAIVEMQGFVLSDRAIRMSLATAKRPRPSGGGGEPGYGQITTGDVDPNNTTLFIGGLATVVTEAELSALFTRFGQIVYVRIPPGKGCGFVQFVERSAAILAMQTLHGHTLHGSGIRISWGKNSSKQSSTSYVPDTSSVSPYGHDAAAWAAPQHAYASQQQTSWEGWGSASYADGYSHGYGYGYAGYAGYEYDATAAQEWRPEPRRTQSTFGVADPKVVDLDALNRQYMAACGHRLEPNVCRLAFPQSQAQERAAGGLKGVLVSSACTQ